MLKSLKSISLIIMVALLAGCANAVPPAMRPTTTTAFSPTTAASATQPLVITATQGTAATQAAATQSATATNAPAASDTATNAPAATSAPAGSSGGSQPDYLDDRSTPSGLVLALFNAINRKEYLRAYSYWENPASNPNVGSLDQYQQGYQNTASVQVTLGTIAVGAAAGNRYYSVPAVLKAQTTSGQTQTFAACYTLHLADPELQAEPPFHPMSIQSAQAKPADNNADVNGLLSTACAPTGSPATGSPTTDPNTIGASNYLDDRSTAVSVLRSLFNAVNRKEYARAYAYWQTPPQTFTQFRDGYIGTTSVEVTFGTPTSDVGAGQLRYRVPVALKAQIVGGNTQFFTGCYQLHLSQPAVQGTPPFKPLGLEKAAVAQAASQADAEGKMAGMCANIQ